MNKGYFIEQIKNNDIKSSPAMIYYDGRICTNKDILTCYYEYQTFCNHNQISSDTRIGLVLDDSFSSFKLGLSILESMTLILIEKESSNSLINECELFHIDYVLVDQIEDLKELEASSYGIIYYHDFMFEMIQKSNRNKTNYHSNTLAYLSKTSGTSDIPKIVPIEYDTLISKQNMNVEHFKMDKHTIQIQTVKMIRFISISNALRVITQHGLVLQTDGIKSKEIIKYLKHYPVNFIVCVPAGIKQILDHMDDTIDLSHCAFVIGGSYLEDRLAQRLQDKQATVISYYGMTECGSIASSYHAQKGYKEGSVGWAKIECKIIDQEICVRGNTVFKGYENTSNEDTFINGWFKTGDIGYMDEDGYLYITGRKSEMINRKGEKISPYEIEKILINHPSIIECVVFPCFYEKNEEVGCAIVLHEGKHLKLIEIRQFLLPHISVFKMPKECYFVKEIPLSDKDKIQRKQLQTLLHNQGIKPEIMQEKTEKLNSTERLLQKCFNQVLNNNTIGLDDDFFEAGGDSLTANELIVLIEKNFNLDLPMDQFLQNRTIRLCTQLMQSKNIKSSKYLIPLNQNQSDVTLVCVHSGDGSAINFHYLAKQTTLKCLAYDINTKRMHDLNPQSLEELIHFYKQEIENMISGDIILVGDCVGGVIAYELATQLLDSRINVLNCILLDSLNGNRKSSKNTYQSSFMVKLKRNIRKIQELSLIEQLNHIKQAIPKMISFTQAYIEKRLLKKDPKKWIKYMNHRTILYYFIRQYKVKPYPKEITYVRSKNQKDEHVEYWKNINPMMKVLTFDCKHDEFLNKNEVKDLSLLIDSYTQA